MSDELYTKKEDARMRMEQAILDYKDAAETYGHDAWDMTTEIGNAVFEAGLETIEVTNA